MKELDKLYAQGAPQDDFLKRAEEMERMREHVFNEADLNKDGLIRYFIYFNEVSIILYSFYIIISVMKNSWNKQKNQIFNKMKDG